MGRQNVLELRGVSKVYGTVIKTQALTDVNLGFEEGSFSAIIGQSGSGKSTLLNILGTLDKPTTGEVLIAGRRTTEMKSNELAKFRNVNLGFIFQFHYLLPEFTVFENVIMPYLIKDKGILPFGVKEQAEKLLALVGLTQVKDKNSQQISGGQQQRTAIARALLNNPKVVLADEPTGNLDSDTTETVYQLLRQINKDFGTAFIIVTHDRRIAEKTDRIIEIRDGRVVMDVGIASTA
ncbi:MAG: ABC transporter ATP-binding protein [Candidatus Lokiarchaeota archaeon]|nr:ABC transporter ATP-binding protein [Candidatus Lokiarchaeota archaeon]